MPDPEGFKAGSAWMDVKPRIDQAEWDAKITAAVEEAGKAQGSPLGRSLTKSLEDAKPELVRDADKVGVQVGDRLGTSTTSGIEKRLRESSPRFTAAGQQAGNDTGDAFGQALLRKMFPASYDQQITDRSRKAGQEAGKAAGGGMSPLIAAGIAAGATIGGPLLLAGVGSAMVGVTALVLRGNQVITADFQRVGKDAANAIQQAAAPLAAEMHSALGEMDTQVTKLQPEFKSLFAAAEPDISAATSGLTGFADKILPGVADATKNSQAIVTSFSHALPILGSNVGGFFTGLVRNADAQGQELEATLNTLGNTVRTVGSVIGSASTAASVPLLGLTHVINGLDDSVRAVSNPATVGGVLGLVGALKFDPAISKGLQSASNGLVTVAAKADGAAGLVGKFGGFVEKASSGLGKMADKVGGPWGLAIGAGFGLISGFTASLLNADSATKALTVDQATLADAIAKDSGKAGQATAAYIAQQAQVSGLADEAKGAGVSLSLLTAAATGNKAAMGQLVSVTDAANNVQRQQQLTAEESLSGQTGLTEAHKQGYQAVNSLYSSTVQLAGGQDRMNQSFATGSQRLLESTVASNTLSDANQQLLASVKAQTQQVADAIRKQADLDAATNALNNVQTIFNATLDANYQKLVQNAQGTGASTVAALNLGEGQSSLNQTLAAAVTNYSLAQNAASAYSNVLQALSGNYGDLEAAEAQTDSNLTSLIKNQQQLGHSFTVGKGAGDQNIQMMNTYTKSILNSAQAIAQKDTQDGKSSQITQDLTKYIYGQRDAFVAQESKLLGSKKAAEQLFDKYVDIKSIGTLTTKIDADTTPAIQKVNTTINQINDSYGTIQVYANVHNPSGGKALGAGGGTGALTNQGYASGGPVTAGSMVTVGEHQQETAVFGQDAYILTHGQTVAMQSRPRAGGAQITNNFYYYGSMRPDTESKAQMLRDLAGVIA